MLAECLGMLNIKTTIGSKANPLTAPVPVQCSGTAKKGLHLDPLSCMCTQSAFQCLMCHMCVCERQPKYRSKASDRHWPRQGNNFWIYYISCCCIKILSEET